MAGSGALNLLSGRPGTVPERSNPASTSCSLSPRPVAQNRTQSLFSSRSKFLSSKQQELRRVLSVQATPDGGSLEDDEDDDEQGQRRGRGGRGGRSGNRDRKEAPKDDEVKRDAQGFEERVLQVSRVTKVVKGGKQMSFRAVVAVGDDKGKVGVGCASAKEVMIAVEKAVSDAKRHIISVPLTRGFTFPHRVDGIAGGAKVMLRPASEGTGVIAGGAVREVLELSGVKNGFGKQLGSDNPLNNARATVDGLLQMRTLSQAARDRDLTVEQMLNHVSNQAAPSAA